MKQENTVISCCGLTIHADLLIYLLTKKKAPTAVC